MKSKEKTSKYQKQTIPSQIIPTDRDEKLVYFLKKVEDRVADELDAETLKISDKKVPFVEPPKDESKQLTTRLRVIQESKEKVQARLREVSQQQRQIKSQQRYHIMRKDPKEHSVSPLNLKTKSQLSQTDLNLLRKLKKEQRQFQRSLEVKTQEYEQKLKDMKKEQDELKQKHKKQQTEARKKEIALKMDALQKKREEKAKQFEEERLRMVQLKTKKKLFEQLELKQKEMDKEEFDSKMAAMEERLKQKEIDLQTIKEHEQRYRERKAELQAERQRKKEEQDEMARQSRLNVEKSKFYTLVVTESKKKKEDELKKMKEKLELVEAARGYAENIKREHAPRVKTKSSEDQKEKEKEKKEGLTFEETKQVGNLYFQFMKKITKKHNKNQSVLTTGSRKNNDTPKPLRTLSTKYKDYLSEQRKNRHPHDEKMSLTRNSRIRDRGMMKEVEQACKLAEGKDQREGLERLQFLASKLQNHKGEEDHSMLDKISAKLKILQTLTNR